ncbi:hypothetical protein OCL88_20100 [Paenarthrobacter sp. PAE-2]|uniref:hypothetical protein n=1 Tax=Paenarthrobacter sp. PAE-2 TaxID=2982532 RepID=UPI00222F0EDD|nr:hypothetical protein [Paenarthrobacter sp. PAE-2]MCW3768780.1 hypothetical protein [Paenarthrobacter sp. PAE-2]
MTSIDEPSLPEGVVHHAGPRQGDPSLGLDVVEIEYRMHGLELVIGWTVSPSNYFSAPDRVTIRPDGPLADFMNGDDPEMGEGEREMFNGVTTPLLRSIPMAHARHLLRRPYEELSSRLVRDVFMPMPDRIESDDDYMHVSCAYVDLVTGPSAEPIRRLSEWTGVKPATWSARLQRARAKGILVGRGRQAHISPSFKKLEHELRARLAARSGGQPKVTSSVQSAGKGK